MERMHHAGWVAEAGGMRLAPSPLLIDGQRAPIRRPPPRLGEHTEEILRGPSVGLEADDGHP